MKHYIIEMQETAEAKKLPVTMNGKVRTFASPGIAMRLARFVKTETGHIVKVVSKGHEGPQEIMEVL